MAGGMKCSFGEVEEAAGNPITCGGVIHQRQEYSEEDLRLLRIRSGSKIYKKDVCDVHHSKYISSYVKYQKKCCNPLGAHAEVK